jgi:heme-degrading monooxygenase HmoA
VRLIQRPGSAMFHAVPTGTGDHMFIAMNRFKVKSGSETAFENIWKNRSSSLADVQGFKEFHLLRGPVHEDEGYTLFASHTVWASEAAFKDWTKSDAFRQAHRNAGDTKAEYLGPPQFEGFTIVEGA